MSDITTTTHIIASVPAETMDSINGVIAHAQRSMSTIAGGLGANAKLSAVSVLCAGIIAAFTRQLSELDHDIAEKFFNITIDVAEDLINDNRLMSDTNSPTVPYTGQA